MGFSFQTLTGALYYQGRSVDFWQSLRESSIVSPLERPLPGWIVLSATPKEPWISEELNSDSLPNYQFCIRRGRDERFMLLSRKVLLVDKLLSELGVESGVQTPVVDVRSLVDDLIARPRKTIYSLGAVWAHINGFGQAFRSIAIYGNDLAGASMVTETLLPSASPYRITLRKSQRIEVLSIGSRGEISFPYRSIAAFQEVDDALRVIGSLGHLNWNPEE